MNGFYYKRKKLQDKAMHAFLTDSQEDAMCKMGVHKWSENSGARTLKIEEGYPNFKRKFEVKLEGNNKIHNKIQMGKETTTQQSSKRPSNRNEIT